MVKISGLGGTRDEVYALEQETGFDHRHDLRSTDAVGQLAPVPGSEGRQDTHSEGHDC